MKTYKIKGFAEFIQFESKKGYEVRVKGQLYRIYTSVNFGNNMYYIDGKYIIDNTLGENKIILEKNLNVAYAKDAVWRLTQGLHPISEE